VAERAGADFEASAGNDVEGGGAFGNLNRMVELRDADDDTVADAHLLGFHRAGGEEDFRGRGVGIFLEEMMLDAPYGIEAELVGECDLFQTIVEDSFLGFAIPRARN
jgi:hypothetical protein